MITATVPKHPDYDLLEVPAVLVQPLPRVVGAAERFAATVDRPEQRKRQCRRCGRPNAYWMHADYCPSCRRHPDFLAATTPPADLVTLYLSPDELHGLLAWDAATLHRFALIAAQSVPTLTDDEARTRRERIFAAHAQPADPAGEDA